MPMTDEPHTRFMRFHTPDPRIAGRERAPMSAEELAWAKEHAERHQFSWLAVLLPPLIFGPVLPGIALLVGLLLYRWAFDQGLDVDGILEGSSVWVGLATVLFTAVWALRNYWRDKRDPTNLYWQTMPAQGLVELERHTLVAGTSVWGNDYDPDINSLMLWQDGELKRVQHSGVSQWVVAKTAAGHLLVLTQGFAGDFSYAREGRMPDARTHLQPCEELAIAFAPGTNQPLGQRFSGAPIPLVDTAYWLAADERRRLIEVAHHWAFFPPDRYAVVNERDAAWVQRLVEKAQASGGGVPG